MKKILTALTLLTAACTSDVGGPQWATVTAVHDRGNWGGCHTVVRTDTGMILTRVGCLADPGERVCVRARRRAELGNIPRYYWEPSPECDARLERP